MEGGIIIRISIHSDRKSVKDFLNELMDILEADKFSVDNDVIVIKSVKENEKYSTPYTLVDLDYDVSDIINRLKELTIKEYSETLIDKNFEKTSLLFVFGKDINDKQVYIKLKIKGTEKKILCLSFHYAEWEMKFPYA